jgi:hypothetical protein
MMHVKENGETDSSKVDGPEPVMDVHEEEHDPGL